MVPGRGVMEQQQRADPVHVDIVGQPHLHGLAARHRIADRIAQQRHARRPELAGLIHGKGARQADVFAFLPMGDDFWILGRTVDAGSGRRFRIGLAELGMIARAMIAFAVVFPDELPVALLDDCALVGNLGVTQPVRQEIGFHHRPERREIHRLVGETDEDVAAGAFAGDRLQGKARRVEILTHLARVKEGAVKVIGPLVIGAHELGRRPAMLLAHPAAAMAAGIVQRIDLAVIAAHDDHRIGADLHGHVIARMGNFAVMADEQPVLVPDMLEVELMKGRIDVEGLVQAVAGFAAAEPGKHV